MSDGSGHLDPCLWEDADMWQIALHYATHEAGVLPEIVSQQMTYIASDIKDDDGIVGDEFSIHGLPILIAMPERLFEWFEVNDPENHCVRLLERLMEKTIILTPIEPDSLVTN